MCLSHTVSVSITAQRQAQPASHSVVCPTKGMVGKMGSLPCTPLSRAVSRASALSHLFMNIMSASL
jgi:hypothetical protein